MKKTTLALMTSISLALTSYGASGHSEDKVSLNFHYQVKDKQQEKNGYKVILLSPKISFSKNIPAEYQEKFDAALQSQIKEILQTEGYEIIPTQNENTLNAQEKQAGYLAFRISGHIDILEENQMDYKNNQKSPLQEGMDMSSGILRFDFLEPLSAEVFHTFSIDLSKIHSKEHYIKRVRNHSGGFMTDKVVHTSDTYSYADSIRKILNQVYAESLEKIDKELRFHNVKYYQKDIQALKSKSNK
ncbi:hypothetical protein BKH46_02375 [Helicobacter sp. 12S02634-8]|uniref:HpaA family protein n=1 Tax=Helicobacter sp. 12S02634-8 TaxID=1476199 RepID=UPI000BA50199|nr:HpaA family protein [Helicobacter sp. 12S02634-8]PAF48173.1 hypothetical protein BKH46_02375 [Helicobacter sp. 12S02634-8]